MELQEEGLGFRLQERPLCSTSRWFRRSLRLWEMLARAARGTGALLLRVRTKPPSSEARDRDHLGPQLGRSGIPTLGKHWGQRSWSPRESFSGDRDLGRCLPNRDGVPRRVLSGLSSFSRALCRLLAELRAAPPLDCPGTRCYCLCPSRRPGWWSEWADSTGSWNL